MDQDEEDKILERLSLPPVEGDQPKKETNKKTDAKRASKHSTSSNTKQLPPPPPAGSKSPSSLEVTLMQAVEKMDETISRLVADVGEQASASSQGNGEDGGLTLQSIARMLRSAPTPQGAASGRIAPKPSRYVRIEYLSAKHWGIFSNRLERPEAAKLRSDLRRFEEEFVELKANDQGEFLTDFVTAHLHAVLSMVPKGAGFTEQTAINCLEKVTMEALYSRAFGHCLQEDLELSNHIASLEFVTHAHLGVPEAFADMSLYGHAQEELYMISTKHVPFEKLECVVSFSRIVLHAMEAVERRRGAAAGAVGADLLLPVVIWVILRANPPCLLSNIEFIRALRYPSLMQEEANYYFVNFTSAVHFIQNLSAQDIGLTKSDFDLGLNDAAAFRRMETERNAKLVHEAEQKRLLLAKQNRARFLTCEAEELDREDVAFLLNDYRRLHRLADEQHVLVNSLREQLSSLVALVHPPTPSSSSEAPDPAAAPELASTLQ